VTNVIDENGIQIDTLAEITTAIETSYKGIYGEDINVDPNSPDGQQINIYAQSGRDLREFAVAIYNSFDPDQAVGVNLDSRVSINLLQRRGGTFTITDVEVVTSQALNLIGLDGEETPPEGIYTIQDSEGNEFYLQTSQAIASASTFTVKFRAATAGEVQVQINTLTIPVSIILGVTSVNNPSSPDSVGIDQELDPTLSVRRQRSTAIVSIGFFESMFSALGNINDIEDQKVLENKTNVTDANGVPPHSYWIIVLGGTDQDVADVIYEKRSGGSGMRGVESVNVTQIDGTLFEVNFDRAINEDLYIKFSIEDIITGNPVDQDFIKTQIVEGINFKIGQIANKTDIECFIKDLLPNVYVKDLQVSNDDITYVDTLDPTTVQHKFVLDESRIDITQL